MTLSPHAIQRYASDEDDMIIKSRSGRSSYSDKPVSLRLKLHSLFDMFIWYDRYYNAYFISQVGESTATFISSEASDIVVFLNFQGTRYVPHPSDTIKLYKSFKVENDNVKNPYVVEIQREVTTLENVFKSSNEWALDGDLLLKILREMTYVQ